MELSLKWRDIKYYREFYIQCISQSRFTRFNYFQAINNVVNKLSWRIILYVWMVR